MVREYRCSIRGWMSLLIPMLLCLIASPLYAQRVEVEAPLSVETGKHFNVSYTVEAESAEVIQAPQYKGLELLYGPAISSSLSMVSVNGGMRTLKYTTFIYTFVAPKEGAASLSPIIIEVAGKQLKSSTTAIKVLPQESRPTQQGEAGHFLYRLIIPNQKTYYVQEAIPVTYRFSGTQGFDPLTHLMSPLEFEGFLSTDLFEMSNGSRQLELEQIKGRNYRSVDIFKYLLYPQREGELIIPSHKFPFRITVAPTPSSPFGSMEERSASTAQTTIRILPLPTEGKPADFSGAVGRFTAKSEINTSTPSVGEALTIKLIIQGSGNLKVASAPSPQFESAFDSYTPEVKYEYSLESGALREIKTITYTLIPRKEGRFVIPPISFSYFDPSTGRYLNIAGKGYEVRVSPSKNGATQTLSVQGSKDKSLSELKLQRGEGVGLSSSLSLVGWVIYIGMYILLLVIGIIAYIILARRDRARADTTSYNASRANTVARKRLRKADELRAKGEEEAFYQELLAALWGYLGHKLEVSPAELSRETISQMLEHRGVAPQVIGSCAETIDAVEFARFAPGSAANKMQSIYTQAVAVISAIEDHKLDRQ